MINKEGWERKKLGEMCEVFNGGTPDTTKKEFWDGSILWITPKDMGRMKSIYVDDTERKITEAGLKNSSARILPINSIVISSRAPIGHLAINTKPICTNQGCKGLVPKDELNTQYLYYFLKDSVQLLNDLGTGATFKEISGTKLGNVKIPIPPLPIQHKIVSELDTLSHIITKKKQQLAELDKLAQATFYDMFGDPVSNEKGWDFKTIEQLVIKDRHAIKRGPFGGALKKEIFVESGYLVYEQFHALNNDFSFARYFIDENDFQRLKTFEVHSGDIIISCSGVYLGKLAIIPENSKKGIINQALLKISLDNNIIDSRFFVFVFSNENFKSTYYGNTIGSGIPNFPPMSDFKKFKFICPPFQLQLQFNKRIESIEKQKALINQSIVDVQQLFDYTMDKYFN